jgi:hypothetical protein
MHRARTHRGAAQTRHGALYPSKLLQAHSLGQLTSSIALLNDQGGGGWRGQLFESWIG